VCNYARHTTASDKNAERLRCAFRAGKAVAANANPISSLGNYIVPTSTHLSTGLRNSLAIVRHAQRLRESAYSRVADARSNQRDRRIIERIIPCNLISRFFARYELAFRFLILIVPKCTDCSAANRNCRPKISCTRQSLNPSGLVTSNWGHSLQFIKILQRFQNRYLRINVNAPCYVNDTLHHFNV